MSEQDVRKPVFSPALLIAGVVLIVVILTFVLWRVGNRSTSGAGQDQDAAFVEAMNRGKNYYEQNDAAKAVVSFQEAVDENPSHPDAHLNLANAYLRANEPEKALPHARE